MSPLLGIIIDARGDTARERAELVARIGADLARLDLLDRFAAPRAQPFGSGWNRRLGRFLMAGG